MLLVGLGIAAPISDTPGDSNVSPMLWPREAIGADFTGNETTDD